MVKLISRIAMTFPILVCLFVASVGAEEQRNPLTAAAASGDLKEVQRLLDKGADVDAKDRAGNSPLIMAAANGHPDVVELLIDRGARVNAWNKFRITPLIAACWGRHDLWQFIPRQIMRSRSFKARLPEKRERIVKLLLAKSAYLHLVGPGGVTALMGAAALGLEGTVQELIDRGAKVNAVTKGGNTALTFAAANGWTEIVKTLLDNGSRPNHPDARGFTALMLAARTGDIATVKVLLARGANRISTNNAGDTATDIASRAGHKKVIKLLKARGPIESDDKSKKETKKKKAGKSCAHIRFEEDYSAIARSVGYVFAQMARLREEVECRNKKEEEWRKKKKKKKKKKKRNHWRGVAAYCECNKGRGKVVYSYKLSKGKGTYVNYVRDRVERIAGARCGGCAEVPRHESYSDAEKKK